MAGIVLMVAANKPWPQPSISCKKITGIAMMVYSNADWTSISLTRNAIQRAHEPVQIYFFTELADLMGASSFFDVGANVGTFSIAMAQIEKVERIYAFEPMKSLYAELAENVRKNDVSRKAKLHNVAVSDRTGFVDFAVVGDYSGANGVVTSLIHDQSNIDRNISVPASTLDDIIESSSDMPEGLCFIKIDVEGHELSVLHGAMVTLERACVLQIENYDSKTQGEAINALMSRHGYRRFWQIGADHYFAKAEMCPTDAELLSVISRSHAAMITDFQRICIPGADDENNAITRRFGPVQVRLFDPLSRWLRVAFRRR